MFHLVAEQNVGLIPPIVVKDEIEHGSFFLLKEFPEIPKHLYVLTLKQSKQGITSKVLEDFNFKL